MRLNGIPADADDARPAVARIRSNRLVEMLPCCVFKGSEMGACV